MCVPMTSGVDSITIIVNSTCDVNSPTSNNIVNVVCNGNVTGIGTHNVTVTSTYVGTVLCTMYINVDVDINVHETTYVTIQFLNCVIINGMLKTISTVMSAVIVSVIHTMLRSIGVLIL